MRRRAFAEEAVVSALSLGSNFQPNGAVRYRPETRFCNGCVAVLFVEKISGVDNAWASLDAACHSVTRLFRRQLDATTWTHPERSC
jgi:hypothetical protein